MALRLLCFPTLLHLAATLLNLQSLTAIHIKLYSNLTGETKQLAYEKTFPSDVNCTNFPTFITGRPVHAEADSCILIYEGSGCTSYFMKLAPNSQLEYVTSAVSFKPCTSLLGGPKLSLDLYASTNRQNPQLASFEEVCGCQNLNDMRNGTRILSSLNNHGNCVRIYTAFDCSSSAPHKSLPGGMSRCTEDLKYCFVWTVSSLEPCEQPRSCLNISATVIHTELLDSPSQSEIDAVSSSIPMSVSAKFSNNGSAVVVQEYTSRKTVSTTNEVEIGRTISEMNRVSTSASATVGAEVGGLFAKASVSATISNAYDYERTETEGRRERVSHTTENEFSITEKIEIPPCEDYEISSFVKVVENLPLRYAVDVEIRGYDGNVQMTAEDLTSRFSDMEWVRDADEFTIVAREYGSMTVSFGTETFVTAQGYKIEGCVPSQK